MKLPLGITLTLLLILQVSTQIPEEWERNGPMDNNETQPSSVTTPAPGGESMQSTQTKPEGSSQDETQSGFGSFYIANGDEQNQNDTAIDHNNTEEASSSGSIGTTAPPMVAQNSSSEVLDTSAESNETQIKETDTNTSTPEPEHTNQPYTSPKPENTTTENSLAESGSGYVPSVPTNSTTEGPATTTKDGSVQNKTAVSTTEPPINRTTKPVFPPTMPEDITTLAPNTEDTGANLTGPFDTKDNSERGVSSDITNTTGNKKGQAWAVILFAGIVVGIIALAAFIILNRRNRRDFSHRKLVEETSPTPVLRLDNSEPLDLKYDGFGYYNSGLQGDNIQMTNFPQGRPQ